jgi:hypothetical protein
MVTTEMYLFSPISIRERMDPHAQENSQPAAQA